jgi:GTP-binding protein
VQAIYLYLQETRAVEHRAQETKMREEAQGILSIDPDDPRFKVIND